MGLLYSFVGLYSQVANLQDGAKTEEERKAYGNVLALLEKEFALDKPHKQLSNR